jgi:branched-chain amino acid transport system substrate-binding protein
MKKILSFFLAALVVALLAGCSDSGDQQAQSKASEPEIDRAAVMKKVLHDAEVYAKQEEERRQKQLADEERPLIIGVVGPETGDQSRYGMSVVNGVLAAAKRFNANGGIDGKKIQVLHYDDKSDMGNASKIVSYFIAQRAIAIISAPTGSSTFSPIHLINDSKTIFVSVGSRRKIEKSGPFVFRSAVPDEIATYDLIKYVSDKLGYVNYALVTDSFHPFSLDLSSLFKKAVYKHHGAIKVEADLYDTFTQKKDVGAVIKAIRESPDTMHGLIYTGDASEGAHLAEELKKAGITLPIIGGEDLSSLDYLEGGEATKGTLLYSTISSDGQSAKIAEFTEDYGKETPDRFAALAYDTFMLLGDAIRIAGSTNTTRVKDALINRKECEGVTGKTSFSAEGSPIKHPLICKIKKGKNGASVVVLKQ